MQNNDRHIDKTFRDKLGSFEVVPPDHVWERIGASMGQKRKKRAGFFIIAISSAASLLLAVMLGYNLLIKPGDNNMVLGDNTPTTELPHSNSNTVIANVAQPSTTIALVEKNDVKVANMVEQTISASNDIVADFSSSKSQLDKKQALLANNSLSGNDEAMAFMVTKSSNVTALNVYTLSLVQVNSKTSDEFTLTDRAIIEANMLALNEKTFKPSSENQGEWSVGVQGSPIYQFDQPSMGLMYDYVPNPEFEQNSISTAYNTTVSGGVMVQYLTNSRFSVQTGVNYSEVTQSGGKVGISFAGNNTVTDRYDKLYQSDKLGSWQNTESLTPENTVVLNTQSGLANMSLAPGASISSNNNTISSITEVAENFDYKQQARYIEVPMVVRYRFIDKKLGMHVLGGINSNFLVNNLVQLANQKEVVANGKIEGLRPLTFSSSIGFGLNYDITEKFQLSLEPTLKMQLNSLNTNSNFNLRPYSIGVFSGIAYRF